MLRKKGHTLRDIAIAMNRSLSTISEEISRNSVRGRYNSEKAHAKARKRRKESKFQGMKIVGDDTLRREVTERLMDDQSPRAISGFTKRSDVDISSVGHNAIRSFIKSVYGRNIEIHRNKRKSGRKRRKTPKGRLSGRRPISERSLQIKARLRIGDAEGDFVVSGIRGKGKLLVVVDRKSRMTFLEKITDPGIGAVHRAFLKIQERFKEMKTMTLDNDILFTKHKELEKELGIKIYFCHPYHSWEKGSVENTNKVIRRDLPKGANIRKYSKRFFCLLEDKLNRRPMKVLNYLTPQEILDSYRKRKKQNNTRKKRVLFCSD